MGVSWPHFRTDVVGIACLVVVAVCLGTARWPAVVVVSLGVALFCAVCPRMKGPFGFSSGGTRIGGTFEEKPKVVLKGTVAEASRNPEPDRSLPSSREPGVD